MLDAIKDVLQARAFCAEIQDFSLLNQLLHAHGLAARAYRLNHTHSNLPDWFLADLHKAYLASIQSTHTFVSLAQELLEQMQRQGIEFAFIKGPVLAQRIYEYPHDRVFFDLDLYFPHASKVAVTQIMQEMGYTYDKGYERFFANEHKLEFFYRGDRRLCVECHFELGYEQFKVTSPIILSESAMPILAPEPEYAFLAFHAGVQHRFQKFAWALDLSLFQKKYATSAPVNSSFARVYRMTNELNQVLFSQGQGQKSAQDWAEKLVDETKLSSWDVAKMRLQLQGAQTFVKYFTQRLISKSKDRLRAGH